MDTINEFDQCRMLGAVPPAGSLWTLPKEAFHRQAPPAWATDLAGQICAERSMPPPPLYWATAPSTLPEDYACETYDPAREYLRNAGPSPRIPVRAFLDERAGPGIYLVFGDGLPESMQREILIHELNHWLRYGEIPCHGVPYYVSLFDLHSRYGVDVRAAHLREIMYMGPYADEGYYQWEQSRRRAIRTPMAYEDGRVLITQE